jgi:hypothetical protein
MITPKLQELEILRMIFATNNPYSLFDFLMFPILTNNPHRPDGFYFSIGLERTYLGYSNTEKPGDFDLLIIPLEHDRPLIDYIGVVEVKICRPTLTNFAREANSSGRTQVLGLVRDDFPFVGLMHIILPEKSDSKEHLNDFYGVKIPGEDISNGLILEERQLGRMKQLGLPDEIGISATALYDYGKVSHSGTSSYEFCKPRPFDRDTLSKRIDLALTSHRKHFFHYKRG